MSDFDYNPAADPSMLTYLAMAGGGRGASPTQNIGNYVQNFERRKAIRGSLYAPNMRTGRPGSGGYGTAPMPNPGAGFGIDQNQVDAANSALAPFGLQTPSHINPFLFFHDQDGNGDPTWAGNHPKVAQALEGAMIGATTPPSNTPGEAISNIMRTVMGIPGMYRQNAAAQMNAPFQTAQEIGGLQKTQAQIEQEHAQTDSDKATAEYHRALAANVGVKPPITKSLQFNNAGDAIVYNPDTQDYQKRPDLSGGPKPTKEHEFLAQDYIDQKNQERQKAGQPPLNADEQLDAYKEYKKAGEAGKAANHKPYLDPNLKLQVDQANNDIKNAQSEYNSVKPKDYIEAQLWAADKSPAGQQRYNDYQNAFKKVQDASDRKNKLMEQHYNYSNSAQQTNESTDDDESQNIPAPIAPVRVPGVTPQPGTQLVQGPADSKGRPTLQVSPMPGTTQNQTGPKQLDETTARKYLQDSGGDKDKARKAAAKDGYKF